MIKLEGIDAVLAELDPKTFQKQVDYAGVGAMNNLAFWVKDEVYHEMERQFNQIRKSYTLRSMRVRKATRKNRKAEVYLRLDGPGKGTPFVDALGHLFVGGTRKEKRFERALIAKGWMRPGQIAVPTNHVPRDQYGNPKKSFIIKLMSFLNLFGEQGYKANMTMEKRGRIVRKKKIGGFMTIAGEEWFISKGKGTMHRVRGGGRAIQELPAGIWRKKGVHGFMVEPLFLFVDQKGYKQFIDMEKIANDVINKRGDEAFDKALRHALDTAHWKIKV